VITDGLTPLNLLALFAFVGGSGVAVLAIGAALIAGRRALARRFALYLGAAWMLYGAAVLIAALTSRDGVLGPGAEKHLCEIDCHLAYSVVGVRTTPTFGSGADAGTRAASSASSRSGCGPTRRRSHRIAAWDPSGRVHT
jgi:hypothetical protein